MIQNDEELQVKAADFSGGFVLLESDDTKDPRFTATAAELEKKGIKDFQLYYALNTIKRLAAPISTASAGPGKKAR